LTKRVVVVGAGLGGLAVAIALRKQGIDAQIYEKARELRPIGAGLSLAPNGLKSLEAINPDIVRTLMEMGRRTHSVNLRKSTGELIAKVSPNFMDKYKWPMLNIRWSCLQNSLAGFLAPDSIHLSNRLVGFEQKSDRVEVYFDNGGAATADLLIGADGINSKVREILMNDGPPRYAGRLSWRGVIKYQNDLLLPNEVTFIAGSDGKNFALFDVGHEYIFWSAGALSSDGAMSDNDLAAKHQVLEIFAGWAPPVRAILEATPPEEIVERPIEDRIPLTHWSRGGVTLLGDAAHAMVPSLGQGANTAFEDAWELSGSLAVQPSIEAALAHYENKRIYRSQIIHARSELQGNKYYQSDNEIFSRRVLEQANADQNEFEDWLYGYMPPAFA
jgi:salicylate hydroxylase